MIFSKEFTDWYTKTYGHVPTDDDDVALHMSAAWDASREALRPPLKASPLFLDWQED